MLPLAPDWPQSVTLCPIQAVPLPFPQAVVPLWLLSSLLLPQPIRIYTASEPETCHFRSTDMHVTFLHSMLEACAMWFEIH